MNQPIGTGTAALRLPILETFLTSQKNHPFAFDEMKEVQAKGLGNQIYDVCRTAGPHLQQVVLHPPLLLFVPAMMITIINNNQ